MPTSSHKQSSHPASAIGDCTSSDYPSVKNRRFLTAPLTRGAKTNLCAIHPLPTLFECAMTARTGGYRIRPYGDAVGVAIIAGTGGCGHPPLRCCTDLGSLPCAKGGVCGISHRQRDCQGRRADMESAPTVLPRVCGKYESGRSRTPAPTSYPHPPPSFLIFAETWENGAFSDILEEMAMSLTIGTNYGHLRHS